MNNGFVQSIVILALLCGISHGQVGPTKPSAANDHWSVSKKVTFLSPKEISDFPPDGGRSDPDTQPVGNNVSLHGWSFYVTQVVDGKNAIVSVGRSTYWLADYPTEELADGDRINIVGPARMIEPRTYETVLGGKKKVNAFKLMSKKELEAEELAGFAKLCEILKTTDGTEYDGRAIESSKGVVTVRLKDGKRVELKLAEFDSKSLPKVRKHLSTQPKKK